MLTTIILVTFIAAAFWREAIKILLAGFVVVLLMGFVQLVQLADEAGFVPADNEGSSQQR